MSPAAKPSLFVQRPTWGVVVASAEAEQARGFVVVTAGEAMGDDGLAGDVLFEDAVGRVAILLRDCAGGGVSSQNNSVAVAKKSMR